MMSNSNEKNIQQQAREFIEKLKNKLEIAKGQKFTFLLIGRTGVGKSSSINSLMGKEVAPVGDYEPTTMEIKHYENNMDDINFILIDTPGLCDDLEEKGNDYQYLELMRQEVKKVDSMWFVSRLDDTRVSSDEKRGIKIICEAFGEQIWQQAVIVFTFANQLNSEKYPIALEKRTELIRKEIAQYTRAVIANNIPAVAIDNKSETTPDGEKWLGELYTQIYLRISNEGALPFLMATVNRIKKPEPEIVYRSSYHSSAPTHYDSSSHHSSAPTHYNTYVNQQPSYSSSSYHQIELNQRQQEAVTNRTYQVVTGAVAGVAVGAAIGSIAGPVGAAVGGVVGGVFGAIRGWFGGG